MAKGFDAGRLNEVQENLDAMEDTLENSLREMQEKAQERMARHARRLSNEELVHLMQKYNPPEAPIHAALYAEALRRLNPEEE